MSTQQPVLPPLDGSVSVLPGLIDFHAQHNPHFPWVVLASEDGARVLPITFLEFAEATHRIAHHFSPLDASLGRRVVCLLLACDSVLYVALIAGLTRAGLIPFPISPRNSPAGIAHVLRKTDCHHIISNTSLPPVLAAAKTELEASDYALHVLEPPTLDHVFPSIRAVNAPVKIPPYPSPTGFGLDDIVIYLHSSGSTGLPKPVPLRHINVLSTCNSSLIVDARDRGVRWASMTLPTFHAMGIYLQLYAPLASGYPAGLYWPNAPSPPTIATPANALAVCRATGSNGMTAMPDLLEAWAKSEDVMKYLTSLLTVGCGPILPSTGDRLARAGVPLETWFGTTECGPVTAIFDVGADSRNQKTRMDWQWMGFPDNVQCRWDPQGDGTFELQVLMNEKHHPAVENLMDVPGYATSDLWVRHPTKERLWRNLGRKEDVIVLSSGQRIIPVSQERLIEAHELVSAAVMFGMGKPRCGILIEPSVVLNTTDIPAATNYVSAIWPTIAAHQTGPAFGQLSQEMIVVTDPARPLPRAPRGTVIRQRAWALYSAEIERLYGVDTDNLYAGEQTEARL